MVSPKPWAQALLRPSEWLREAVRAGPEVPAAQALSSTLANAGSMALQVLRRG